MHAFDPGATPLPRSTTRRDGTRDVAPAGSCPRGTTGPQ
jgi:hypothetical protein